MTVNEGDKEEEKFEFDSAGEALGYISLDQARVLALRHARDNRDFYGRYATTDLVWEELNAEESEDYYRVTLSYRPTRGFRGRPGVEQLTIDKAGPIEIRQILREPRPVWPPPVLLSVITASMVAAAAIGALFATGVLPPKSGPPVTSVRVPVSPDQSTLLVSPQGRVRVDLGAGAVDRPVVLTYRPATLEQSAQRPPGLIPTSPVFDLSVDVETGSEDGHFTFNAPVTLTVQLPVVAEDLAGGVASNVVIQHFSSVEAGWTALATTVDFRSSTAQAPNRRSWSRRRRPPQSARRRRRPSCARSGTRSR